MYVEFLRDQSTDKPIGTDYASTAFAHKQHHIVIMMSSID